MTLTHSVLVLGWGPVGLPLCGCLPLKVNGPPWQYGPGIRLSAAGKKRPRSIVAP